MVSTGTPYGSIFRSSNTEPSTPDAASSAGYAGRSQRTMRSFWRLRAAPASGSPARASVTGVNSDGAGDHPVGLGQIKSLSHPGGNFTGFTFIDPELIGKWMELLGDVAPGLTQAGILFNPDTMNPYPNFVREVQETQKSKVSLKLIPVRTTDELTSAMQSVATSPGSGLMIGPDPFNQVHLKQMAELATKLRLPTISVYRSYVTAGGLMGYGPDVADVFRRSAAYVDRILKGEKPADLPVQQPNKFEFIINLRTAKALGLTVPPTLLATADETIE